MSTPLERVRHWLAEAGADAAVLTKPASVAYLTGAFVKPHERLLELVITQGSAELVLPALDSERVRAAVRDVELVPYEDGEDRLRSGFGVAAVEKDHITLALAERLRAAELIDVAPEIRRLRMRKEPAEIARLDRAAALTYEVIETVRRALRPGMTELAVAGLVLQETAARGGEPSFDPLVQSGPNSAFPHGGPTSRAIADGDLVLIDVGVAWEGYKGDITRTFALGRADDEQQEIIEVVQAAHDAAVATVRPGLTCGEVDAAARRVIEEAGYGDRFIHRTGHGLGLEEHEDPTFAPGDPTVLEPGMVVTVEPGIYIPGWGGVRIEDDVLVTADGRRVLNATT